MTLKRFYFSELSDDDVVAQALVFFVAGFDSVATVLCFICYELALNPHVQKKLQEEIDDTLKNCDGQLTYDKLVKMKYLDNVISGKYMYSLAKADPRRCARRELHAGGQN